MSLGKLITSKGYKTKNALQSGYIEPHPTLPCIYLAYEYDSFIIRGYDNKNKKINKTLLTKSVTQARKELLAWHLTHPTK